MIYLDSSVALAYLTEETRRPPDSFWLQRLCASRLLQFEVWNRLNRYAASTDASALTHGLFARVALLELTSTVLARALDPFPVGIRTIDSLHLATLHYVRASGTPVALASYDARMIAAAEALDFEIAEL